MADNVTLPGTGTSVRAKNISSQLTQLVQLDIGGETAELQVVGGQNTMANSIPVVLASDHTKVPTTTYDGSGNVINSLAQGVGQNGMLSAQGATSFFYSTVNSSSAQLNAGQAFVGTVESMLNSPAISFLMRSDQPGILLINQWEDAGGTLLTNQWKYNISANIGFGVSFVINGNYVSVQFTNTGYAATTNLNINSAYGTISPATQLGNNPTAITEIAGVQIPFGSAVPVQISGIVPTTDSATAGATSQDAPLFVSVAGDPSGDYSGLNLLEQVLDPSTGLSLQTSLANVKLDKTQALFLSDMAGPYFGSFTATTGGASLMTPIDTTGYNTVQFQCGVGTGTVIFEGSNDGTPASWVQVTGTMYATAGSSIATNIAITPAAPIVALIPAVAKFIRARCFAYTSGILQITAYLRNGNNSGAVTSGIVNLNAVGGTATVTAGLAGVMAVGGNTAENVTTTANGLMATGYVRTAALTAQTAGTGVRLTQSSGGALVISPHSVPDVRWQATSGTTALATTTSTALNAAGAAGIRNYCTSLQIYNSSATISTTVTILDGATVIWTGFLPAMTASIPMITLQVSFDAPLKGTAATAINIQLGTTAAAVYYNAQGFQAP